MEANDNNMKFPELSGKRIRLGELSLSGLEDMYEYSKNPLLYRYFEFDPQIKIEETKEYLRKLITRSQAENAHYWFIRLIEDEKVIGSFGVHDIDWRKKDGEISYGISPDYWGKGLFIETVKVVLDYLFTQLDFHRVNATTRYDNLPSIKGLEKVGFQKEGTLREYYLSSNGIRYDAAVLAILNHEYNVYQSHKKIERY